MRHVVIARPGGYGQLKVVEAPDPVPPENGAVVNVAAAGVNYADCIVRMGFYTSAWKYVGYPITPGFEFAGTVAAVGPQVTDLRVGEEVMGVTLFGGYASRVAVPRHQLFRLPKGYSLEQAAAFPGVALTAHQALVELANVRPGQTVLVHSAAGGVGSAAVAQAKLLGAKVVAVVGNREKVAVAQGLGADVVIDKQNQELWPAAEAAAPGGYDVVLDANGVSTLRQSYRHLRPTGRLVVYGFHSMLPKTGRWAFAKLAWDFVRTPLFSPLTLVNENKSVLAFNLSFLFGEVELLERAMGRLFAWADAGQLPPPQVRTYRLDQVADAHRDIESGLTTGKLVLLP